MDEVDPVVVALDLDPDEVSMVTARLVVASYIKPDGSSGFFVSARGEMPATYYLGLAERAKQEVLGWE